MKHLLISVLVSSAALLTGCVMSPSQPQVDVSAYKAHMPHSILILPPINNSPDVKATYSYWSTATVPVAEAGYYVFPLSVVDTMFKENGVTNGADAQSISPQKLRRIFGADAALYLQVNEYGTKYQVLQSVSTVAVKAQLIDLHTGETLWTGSKRLEQSSNEGSNNGLLGAMVSALVTQIASSLKDYAYPLAQNTSLQLFTPNNQRVGQGLLYGPRAPKYQHDGQTQ